MVEETIAGRSVLTQPAGHLDPGESLVDAVVREVREETGLEFSPTALVGIYRWVSDAAGTTWLRFTFTGSVPEGSVPAPVDPDIDRADWFTLQTLVAEAHRLRSPQVMAGLEDYNKGRRFDLALLKELS